MAKCPDCGSKFQNGHSCSKTGKVWETVVQPTGTTQSAAAPDAGIPAPEDLRGQAVDLANEFSEIFKADKSPGGILGEVGGDKREGDTLIAVGNIMLKLVDRLIVMKETNQQQQGGQYLDPLAGVNWGAQVEGGLPAGGEVWMTASGPVVLGGQPAQQKKTTFLGK